MCNSNQSKTNNRVEPRAFASFTPSEQAYIERALGNEDGNTPPAERKSIDYLETLCHAIPKQQPYSMYNKRKINGYAKTTRDKAMGYIKKYPECRTIAINNRILAGDIFVLNAEYQLLDVVLYAQKSVCMSEYNRYNDSQITHYDREREEDVKLSEFCARHYVCNGYAPNGKILVMTIEGLEKRLIDASVKTVKEVIKLGTKLSKERKEKENERYEKWSHADRYEVKRLNRLYCPLPNKEYDYDEDKPPFDYTLDELTNAYDVEKKNFFGYESNDKIWVSKYANSRMTVQQAIDEGYVLVKSAYTGTAYTDSNGRWIKEKDLRKYLSQMKSAYKKALEKAITAYEEEENELKKVQKSAYPMMAEDWENALPSRLYIEAHYLNDYWHNRLLVISKRRDEERKIDELYRFWDPFIEGYLDYVNRDDCCDLEKWLVDDELTNDEIEGMTYKKQREMFENKCLSEDAEEMLRREKEAMELDEEDAWMDNDTLRQFYGDDYDDDEYNGY